MILYFSGTGNSERIARGIARRLGDGNPLSIPRLSPYNMENLYPEFFPNRGGESCRSLGFVLPIYSWGIPPLVLEFISRLSRRFIEKIRENVIPIWVVVTYGDEAGKGLEMFEKALRKQGLTLSGAWGVQTPNVYVLLPGFGVDSPEVERKKLEKEPERLDAIAKRIIRSEWERDIFEGPFASLKTTLTYPLFKRWGVSPKRWHVNVEKCVSCGACVNTCPVENISLNTEGRHPEWGKNCTSCCACFHICPTRAIDYASITRKAAQFHRPPEPKE